MSKFNFNIDNIEDNETTLSKSKYNSKSQKLSYEEYTYVDLGLPSGVKWCKYNLGANTETDYGDYYAWGELTTKSEYMVDNYTYKDDQRKRLSPKFDVATQKLGKNYSIPTKKLCEELLKYTDKKWINNYKGTSINGCLCISKINDNSIFIPAAGYRHDSLVKADTFRILIWSSNLYTEYHRYAWFLYILSDSAGVDNNCRHLGFTIRPIFK